ncbi:MAG: hypothetical protein KF692_01910 [Cryobacterium sp.]|nr:hypothetical protein [Cryobacterium sp.]
MNIPKKVYPRINDDAVGELLTKVLATSVKKLAADESSADVSDASWYPMASERATKDEIERIQDKIREIAKRYGYPEPLSPNKKEKPNEKGKFDSDLTRYFGESLKMIPADAASDSVWAFLSLRVCPDVAVWRFPPNGELEDIPGTRKAERYNGQQRDVFRRLWWRSYVLGADRVEKLIEDALVQVMERPEISGYRELACALVDSYLAKLGESPSLSKQELMRGAAKHLVLRMAVTSAYALNEQELRSFADEAVQSAALDLGVGPVDVGDEISREEVAREESVRAQVEEEFLQACVPYRDHVEKILGDASEAQMLEIRSEVQRHRAAVEALPEAVDLADRVEELLDKWDEFELPERRVAYAAARYFIQLDDAIPDTNEGGLDDDEVVIRAARIMVGLE